MENELISKKDLLEQMGISYGQLYRWKRKMLIPEEWFIRKSTFTGQETFFPRDKIVQRISKIMTMKDDASLDELADILSPSPAEVEIGRDEIVSRAISSDSSLSLFEDTMGKSDNFAFDRLLSLHLLDRLLRSGEISLEEGRTFVQTFASNFPAFEGRQCDLLCIRKMGVSVFALVSSPSLVRLDEGAKLVTRISISGSIEELKLKVNGGTKSGD